MTPKDIEESAKFAAKILKVQKEIQTTEKGLGIENSSNVLTFEGRKKVQPLTQEEKKACHQIIHMSALACAGISAPLGEFNIQSGILSFGPKGLEIVTSAIASYAIENSGKMDSDAYRTILGRVV